MLFKNDDDFFMNEDVDYQPVKMERDEGAVSAEGKAIQQHQQQLQHQRQLAQLQELQQQLRQQQRSTNPGDPGSHFHHLPQSHSTDGPATSVLFPVIQVNASAPMIHTQPSPTLIATSLSLGAESSSSKPPTPATSTESEYERSVTGPGSEGSLSRRTSRDVDNFGQVLQMTSTASGPSSIQPGLQYHQQQQQKLPPGTYCTFFRFKYVFVDGWHRRNFMPKQNRMQKKKSLPPLYCFLIRFFSCMSQKKRPRRRLW